MNNNLQMATIPTEDGQGRRGGRKRQRTRGPAMNPMLAAAQAAAMNPMLNPMMAMTMNSAMMTAHEDDPSSEEDMPVTHHVARAKATSAAATAPAGNGSSGSGNAGTGSGAAAPTADGSDPASHALQQALHQLEVSRALLYQGGDGGVRARDDQRIVRSVVHVKNISKAGSLEPKHLNLI